jgi:2-alkenal reductase
MQRRTSASNMNNSDQFWRITAVVALVLLAVLAGERYFTVFAPPATEPRPIAPRGDLGGDETRASSIFASVAPSVVAIHAGRAGIDPDIENSSTGGSTGGAGSGFIWDGAGHIVTNNHVVEGASEIGVVLDDGRRIPARVVGTAPWADLAVVRLTSVPTSLTPINVGRSSDLLVGQNVYAFGNPFGLSRSLTTGIISAIDRRLPTQSGRVVTGVIQTDAAINPGNSGGPLTDSAGRLIGVNTAILAPSGTFAGVGFAIPVDTVNRIVPSLIKNGRAPLPGIGISALSEEVSARAGVRGVIVQGVRPGSSAAAAGLSGVQGRQIGDVIVAVQGKPVSSTADMSIVLEAVGVGNTARLTVLRNGQQRQVDVVVQDINGA